MKEFPVIRSIVMYVDLCKLANKFASEFEKEVIPVLSSIGLSDDASIRKYIHSRTCEDIYRDAMANNPTALSEDKLCKLLRAPECSASTPIENGFSFRSMPLSDDIFREKILRAITVEDGHLSISFQVLKDESKAAPEPWMVECYEMVSEFCMRLQAKNFKRKRGNLLFAYDRHGDLTPNFDGIFGIHKREPRCKAAPEPWMVECYEMVSEFCMRLQAKGFKIKNIKSLFEYDSKGRLSPYWEGIVWGNS